MVGYTSITMFPLYIPNYPWLLKKLCYMFFIAKNDPVTYPY